MSTPREDVRGRPTDISGLPVYKPSTREYYLKMLIYGDPGVGKTTLAASAAAVKSMSEVLFINVEGGALAISDPSVYGAKEVPDTVDFNGFDALSVIFKALARMEHPYKTVVIDSLSELTKYNLDDVIRKKMASTTNRQGKVNRDEDDVFLEDYGTMTKQMRRVVRMFRDLPMHVIYTSHAEPYDEGAKVGPDLSNKLRSSVVGYMDVVGYMFTSTKTENPPGKDPVTVSTRKLLTRPIGKFMAKDRSPGGKLGQIIEEPTMTIIMDKINS